jgi:dolichol kinase
MKKHSFISRIFRFYWEGFRAMTIGKTLWLIILLKLFIMFVILKVFFFPDYLKRFETQEEKQEYISTELIERAIHP